MVTETAWNVDDHKAPGEDEVRWHRRRSFLATHQGRMAELELVFLSQLFTNIEFMCCKYPDEAMHQLGLLPPKTMADEFRKTLSTKLKRKFDVSMGSNSNARSSTVPEKGAAVVQKQEPKKKTVLTVTRNKKLIKLRNWLKKRATAKKQLKKTALETQPVDLRTLLGSHSPNPQLMNALPTSAPTQQVLEIPKTPINLVAPAPPRIHSPITFDKADVEDNKPIRSDDTKVDKFTTPTTKRSKFCISFNNSAKKPYEIRNRSLLMEPVQPTPSTSSAASTYNPGNYYYLSPTSAFDPRMADNRNASQSNNDYQMIDYNFQHHQYGDYQQYPGNDYKNYDEQQHAPYEEKYQHNETIDYPDDFHGANRQQDFTRQPYGKVIVLDWCNPQKLRRSVEILSTTALHHHMLMKFVYRKCERFHYCTASLVGILSASSETPANSKEQSRIMACTQLLYQLQQNCYTIQSKPDCPPRHTLHIDSMFIDVNRHAYEKTVGSNVCDNRLTSDNKGFQMMKQLGWSGGALGTSGTGIEEPIQVQLRANRRGLGLPAEPSSSRVPEYHFEFFESFLKSYARKSHSIYPIDVNLNYGQKEWRLLAEIVTKCGLKLEYTSSGPKHQTMHIEKIISPEEMAENIRQGGVYANYYNLFPPNHNGN